MNLFVKFILLNVLMFSSSFGHAQPGSLFISEIKPIQKEIIAKLSGYQPIKNDLRYKQLKLRNKESHFLIRKWL